MLCVMGFREFVDSNASAPTVQLQNIMVVLSVIAYRKWDFRAMDVSSAFLTCGHLERETYAELPDGAEKENIACGLLRPLYGMRTA